VGLSARSVLFVLVNRMFRTVLAEPAFKARITGMPLCEDGLAALGLFASLTWSFGAALRTRLPLTTAAASATAASAARSFAKLRLRTAFRLGDLVGLGLGSSDRDWLFLCHPFFGSMRTMRVFGAAFLIASATASPPPPS
jgi:hypothetical protein